MLAISFMKIPTPTFCTLVILMIAFFAMKKLLKMSLNSICKSLELLLSSWDTQCLDPGAFSLSSFRSDTEVFDPLWIGLLCRDGCGSNFILHVDYLFPPEPLKWLSFLEHVSVTVAVWVWFWVLCFIPLVCMPAFVWSMILLWLHT